MNESFFFLLGRNSVLIYIYDIGFKESNYYSYIVDG